MKRSMLTSSSESWARGMKGSEKKGVRQPLLQGEWTKGSQAKFLGACHKEGS